MVEKLSICFPVGGILIYGDVDKKERPRTSVWVTVTTECREKKAGDCKYDCLHCPYQDFSKERKYLKKYRRAMISAVKLAYAELKKVEDGK
jgi:hypothetical protein